MNKENMTQDINNIYDSCPDSFVLKPTFFIYCSILEFDKYFETKVPVHCNAF